MKRIGALLLASLSVRAAVAAAGPNDAQIGAVVVTANQVDIDAGKLAALARLNELHRQRRQEDSRLSARIASFELAFRMQEEAPRAFSLAGESQVGRRAVTVAAR